MARAAGDDLSGRVGARLRERRNALGLTLVRTARTAGVSASHLSSIETGANLPSLAILARVASALDLSLNEVLRDIGGAGATSVAHVDDAETGVRSLSHKELQLRIASLVADSGEGGDSPLATDAGEVFVYVRTGALEVTVDGKDYRLRAGDSLTAEAPAELTWRSIGARRSLSVWASG